ncbi:hypothetical protein [Burkholderia ubonensis]|uniref:hypothetical protein n=1 Tax=Burkholderia ubonensis TaxID=101571 RepID=UPI0012FA8595|nr:hypothetical protein [Burkholderia ubonensis]
MNRLLAALAVVLAVAYANLAFGEAYNPASEDTAGRLRALGVLPRDSAPNSNPVPRAKKNPRLPGQAWWSVFSTQEQWNWLSATPNGLQVWLYDSSTVSRNIGGDGAVWTWHFITDRYGKDAGSQQLRMVVSCRERKMMVSEQVALNADGMEIESGFHPPSPWASIQRSTIGDAIYSIVCQK